MTEQQTATELKAKDIASLSFEKALAQLETIVRDLESGKETLESSITAYSNGTALKNHCEKKLQEAKLKVEKIMMKADGTVTTEEF